MHSPSLSCNKPIERPTLAVCQRNNRVTFSPRGDNLVYVDDAEVWKYGRGWFHLTADSLEELHAFAVNIGFSARAFHQGARHPHYDITKGQRVRALCAGAHPVTAREIVRIARQTTVHASSNTFRNDGLQGALFA